MVSDWPPAVVWCGVGHCACRLLLVFTLAVLASVHLCVAVCELCPDHYIFLPPGNCFGEDGCQQIQDFVESNGLTEVFEPLDEDEGSEEEGEGESDDDEGKHEVQKGEGEEHVDDEEGELVKDEHLQVKGEKIDADRAARLAAEEEELGDVSSASRTA